MRLSTLLVCALWSARSLGAPVRWDAYSAADYVRDFGRAYTAEEAWRLPLLEARLAAVAEHNAGASSYRRGVNQFTDRSDAELRSLRGVSMHTLTPAAPRPSGVAAPLSDETHVDWRDRGVLTAVKNQGGCGSCWAFAASEALESEYALTTGRLELLSVQQVLECVPNPMECGGDGGCTGGTPELAFAAITNSSGIASEWSYPYTSFHGDSVFPCSLDARRTPPVARVTGHVKLPSNDQGAVLEALQSRPLAVNVDASAWFSYSGGVFTGCDSSSPDIDHAVQLVGAGVDQESGLAYWLIRNSWSSAWGEQGFMRLLRTPEPLCAEDVRPFDGSDCRNVSQPVKEVRVCGQCGILYDVSYPLVSALAQPTLQGATGAQDRVAAA